MCKWWYLLKSQCLQLSIWLWWQRLQQLYVVLIVHSLMSFRISFVGCVQREQVFVRSQIIRFLLEDMLALECKLEQVCPVN